jgi:hypothetical protein
MATPSIAQAIKLFWGRQNHGFQRVGLTDVEYLTEYESKGETALIRE